MGRKVDDGSVLGGTSDSFFVSLDADQGGHVEVLGYLPRLYEGPGQLPQSAAGRVGRVADDESTAVDSGMRTTRGIRQHGRCGKYRDRPGTADVGAVKREGMERQQVQRSGRYDNEPTVITHRTGHRIEQKLGEPCGVLQMAGRAATSCVEAVEAAYQAAQPDGIKGYLRCRRLMLVDRPDHDSVPPNQILDEQCIVGYQGLHLFQPDRWCAGAPIAR